MTDVIKVPTFSTKKSMIDSLRDNGVKGTLFSVGSDAKTIKGEKVGYTTAILYMQPSNVICPAAKAAGCMEGCLSSAGRAAIFAAIPKARQAKTDLYHNNPGLFFASIISEIEALRKKHGNTLVVRLNGTSDISYENIVLDHNGVAGSIFDLFPDVQFYDYTKRVNRLAGNIPANYDLTVSWSGSRASYADSVMQYAKRFSTRVAVVFKSFPYPESFKGMTVVDGDETDLRFLDDKNVVVALKAKGKARKDTSGFVFDNKNIIAVG